MIGNFGNYSCQTPELQRPSGKSDSTKSHKYQGTSTGDLLALGTEGAGECLSDYNTKIIHC